MDLDQWDAWSYEKALSVFGLCIFGSAVLNLQLWAYYYIYKFFRRRNQQVTDNKDPARMWNTTKDPWIDWFKALNQTRRIPQRPKEICVLVTDASMTGWGAVMFLAGTVRSTGGPWPKVFSKWNAHINELEAAAVQRGLESLVPVECPVDLRVDNTTVMYSLLRRRSRSFHINKCLMQITKRWKILSITYVKSQDNVADALSRANYVVPKSAEERQEKE